MITEQQLKNGLMYCGFVKYLEVSVNRVLLIAGCVGANQYGRDDLSRGYEV